MEEARIIHDEVKLGQGVNAVSISLENFALTKTTVSSIPAKKVIGKFFLCRTIRETEDKFDASLGIKGPATVPGIKVNFSSISKKQNYELYSAISLYSPERVDTLEEGFTLNPTAKALLKQAPPPILAPGAPPPVPIPPANSPLLSKFASLYGDAYVNSITYGLWAFIVIQFHLASSDQQRKLKTELTGLGGGIGGGISVDAAFGIELTKTLKDLDYTIHIFSGGIDQPTTGILKDEDALSKLMEKFSIEKQEAKPVQLQWTYKPYYSAAVNEVPKSAASATKAEVALGNFPELLESTVKLAAHLVANALPAVAPALPAGGGGVPPVPPLIAVPAPAAVPQLFDNEVLSNLEHIDIRSGHARKQSGKISQIQEFIIAHLRSFELPEIEPLLLATLTAGDPHQAQVYGPPAVPPVVPPPPPAAAGPLNIVEQVAQLTNANVDIRLRPIRYCILRLKEYHEILETLRTTLANNITNHDVINQVAVRINQLIDNGLTPLNNLMQQIFMSDNTLLFFPLKRIGNHAIGPKGIKHKKSQFEFNLELPDKTDLLCLKVTAVPPAPAAGAIAQTLKLKKHEIKDTVAVVAAGNRAKGEPSFSAKYKIKPSVVLDDIRGEKTVPVTENMRNLYIKRKMENGKWKMIIEFFMSMFMLTVLCIDQGKSNYRREIWQ